MRVLLADDQPQVRSALRLLLEHDLKSKVVGEVVYADDLPAQIEATQPDLLLLDWELPGVSTKDLLPRLNRRFPHLSTIVLSGRPESEGDALAAGADAFISKGYPPEHLLKQLRAIGAEEGGDVKHSVVKEWMTTKLVTVTPSTVLPVAHRLMVERSIHRLPVLNDQELVGIVTLGDVLEAKPPSAKATNIREWNVLLSTLNVGQVMTPNPKTISPEKTVGEAAWLMQQHQVSGLPVVGEHGNLVGIITSSDIFRMIVLGWSQSKQEQHTKLSR